MVVGFSASVVRALSVQAPLGHDEAVYALRARDLSEGWSNVSGAYFSDYRASGLPVILNAVGRVFGHHVSVYRGVVLLSALVVVGCVWWLARHLGGELAAVVAVAFLVVTSGFHMTASMVLTDTPGAAAGMLGIVLFVREFDAGRLRYSLFLVPLLCVGGTFIRFGVPFLVGPALLATVALGGRALVRERNWVLLYQSTFVGIATILGAAYLSFSSLVTLGHFSVYEANTRLGDSKG
jgi:4-amino-4-deoxy-L-arabinose transferase-like glycosyltransferase